MSIKIASIAAVFVFSLTGCGLNDAAPSVVKDAVDASSLPLSLHGKALPLGSQVGVVMSVTTSSLGGFDTATVDDMTQQLIQRNAQRRAAGKKLFFLAPAINAHAVFFSSLAARKIAEKDAEAVAQAKADLGLDDDAVESQVVLFFNDSSTRQMKTTFGNDDDVSVAVLDAHGQIVGKFTLPGEQDAALAALDAALAAQDQP